MKDLARPVPSIEDELQQEATEAAVRGLVDQMKRFNPARPMRALNQKELEMMAIGAISGWTQCRARQEARQKDSERLATLLA